MSPLRKDSLTNCILGERDQGHLTKIPMEQTLVDILDLWERLVIIYSKLSLSYESDKLIALSVIATRLASSSSDDTNQPPVRNEMLLIVDYDMATNMAANPLRIQEHGFAGLLVTNHRHARSISPSLSTQ